MECFFPFFSFVSAFKRPLVQWSAFFLSLVESVHLKGHLSSGVLIDLGFFSCGYQRFTQLYFFSSLRVRIMRDVSSLHLYTIKMLKLITYKRHIRTCITVQFCVHCLVYVLYCCKPWNLSVAAWLASQYAAQQPPLVLQVTMSTSYVYTHSSVS